LLDTYTVVFWVYTANVATSNWTTRGNPRRGGRFHSPLTHEGFCAGAYTKAVQGMSAEDAVKWADGEVRKVYG
jgi:hypothetical protein